MVKDAHRMITMNNCNAVTSVDDGEMMETERRE